ncbi:MerC domain-containing protein [Bacteriovorax sp. Seq25_V]|uniref:MerC domain-containing protein n=1 Tax=Bacteriovorax sp. Seq25_V TaxID=1201288 RepID=UPI00038A332C|nr:MerC domain-containing protein [Bacteriovorax sp. Seq25_V]EQC46095.1 MerC mercury resistance protein [Bacteriovorax sp. Seq25_V]
MSTNAKDTEITDKAGIIFSALCCIHCMAIPFLIMFAPAIGQYFENPLIHMIGMGLVIPLGLYTFISKLKVHSDKRPLYIGIVGMLFLISGHLFHTFLGNELAEVIEIASSIIGGGSLIAAHVLNIKLCRCHTCHH